MSYIDCAHNVEKSQQFNLKKRKSCRGNFLFTTKTNTQTHYSWLHSCNTFSIFSDLSIKIKPEKERAGLMVFLLSAIILPKLQLNLLSHPPQSSPRKHWEEISTPQRADWESTPDSPNHWPTIHASSIINQRCCALTQLQSGRAWQSPGGSSPSPTVEVSVQIHLT